MSGQSEDRADFFPLCMPVCSDPSLQFLDWLYRLMMTNIAPGACFQRRRACLDIVQGWLETIIFVEADGAKKGKAHGGFLSLY